jgi:hypothetical protein
LKEIGWELNVLPEGDRRRRESWINAIGDVNPPLLQLLETASAEDVQSQELPIIETVEASPAGEGEQALEPPIESKFGRIVYPRPAQELLEQAAKTSPGVEVDRVSEAIVPVAENSPGVEVDRVEDFLPECSDCFGDGYIEEEFGVVKFCQCEPKLSHQKTQSAIAPATKISKSDQNSILTGIVLSDRFLARYAPPQAETLHYEITDGYKVDTDGQLSFFEAQVVSEPEPPDPDDFESLDAFPEALARWNAENAEMLAVSMDSMCEWAPCPDEWYEPEHESLPLNASSMMELSPPAIECSITSANFTIPTFDAWCDRANRQTDTDEPPDTGIFARLPGPKPPKFPPRAIGYTQPNRPLNTASRNYPETIPKLFSVAAGSSTQPARSPPGGDA